jgi:hypothetical protein
MEAVDKPNFEPKYLYELKYDGESEIKWYKLTVSSGEGYIKLRYIGDSAQLYADGELVADDFFYGAEWVVPAKLLYGKEVYFAFAAPRDNYYLEVDIKQLSRDWFNEK